MPVLSSLLKCLDLSSEMASKTDAPKKSVKAVGPNGEPVKATTSRVFVGNLSWSTSKDALREYMETTGTVTSCDILLDYMGRSKVRRTAFRCHSRN